MDREDKLGAGWAWLAFLQGCLAGILCGMILPGIFAIAEASVTWHSPWSPPFELLTSVTNALASPLPWTSAGFAIVIVLCAATRGEPSPALAGATLCSLFASILLLTFL